MRPTRTSRFRLAAATGVIAILAGSPAAPAQSVDSRLQYQKRGDHYEGLRAEPISGSVRLLSARIVDEQAARSASAGGSASWGERAVLRFYLPSAADLSVVVRQVRPGSTYYVMDRIESSWIVGRENEYAWPTAPVLRKLEDVKPEDLGAVVGVGPNTNPNDEKVLPVVLFADVSPSSRTYRFTFKTDARAKVEATILDGDKRVGHRDPHWEDEGSPFVVGWTPEPSAKENWYRLLLTGQFEDGTKLDKVVRFYHRSGGSGAAPSSHDGI